MIADRNFPKAHSKQQAEKSSLQGVVCYHMIMHVLISYKNSFDLNFHLEEQSTI